MLRNIIAGIDEQTISFTSDPESAGEDAVAVELGPNARIDAGNFEIGDQKFPRRQFPEFRPTCRTAVGAGMWSFTHADYVGALANRNEVFRYVTPSMAAILTRMAEIATNNRIPTFILLTGPTGCGKTTMAKTFCYLAHEPFVELNFSGDTTIGDFFRRTELEGTESGQSTLGVLGPAAKAMLVGKKLIINEINMLPPDLLSVLTQAMDTGRFVLSGLETGNVEVELHEDFGIIATANPNYVGTMEIGRSLERRFGLGIGNLPMTFLPQEEEAEAVKSEFDRQLIFEKQGLTANPNICERLVALADALRNHREIGDQMRDRVSTRTLVHWLSLATMTGMPLADVGQRAVLTIAPPELQEQTCQMVRASLGAVTASPVFDVGFERVLLPMKGPLPGEAVSPPETLGTEFGWEDDECDGWDDQEQVQLSNGYEVKIFWYRDRPPALLVSDSSGEPIVVDALVLADVRRRLRWEHGLNLPVALGSIPSREVGLPCLTRSTWSAIRLAQGALLGGYPVFLRGPTGSGKSALARTLARLWGLPTVEFSLTGETAKGDLTAVRQLQGGTTCWSIQAFMQAVRDGLFVIVNEYNMAYPDVHSIINSLFDKGRSVTLPDGSRVRAHADFRMVVTGCIDGPGVKPLNEAVENRFGAVVAIDYPPPNEETAILEYVGGEHVSHQCISGMVELASVSRALLRDSTDFDFAGGISNIPADMAATVAEVTALTTAEMVMLVDRSRSTEELVSFYRRGILDATSVEIREVLEPVLVNYGLGA